MKLPHIIPGETDSHCGDESDIAILLNLYVCTVFLMKLLAKQRTGLYNV